MSKSNDLIIVVSTITHLVVREYWEILVCCNTLSLWCLAHILLKPYNCDGVVSLKLMVHYHEILPK